MDKETDVDKIARDALVSRHGTIIINDPTRALIATAEENSQLHEEMDRCHRELDVYRNALTIIAHLSPQMVGGGVDAAFDKCQSLARAALSQLLMGSGDLALLRQATQRRTDGRDGN